MTKLVRTLFFSISLVLVSIGAIAQKTDSKTKNNTNKLPKANNSYGIRLGTDLNRLVRSFTSNKYKGFELMADYRLTKKIFLAGELGNEEKITREESISTTTKGNYIKLGIDYNVYKNLVGMRNLIFVGARYGYASFSQNLDSFSIANPTSFFDAQQFNGNLKESSLNAHWAEFLAGIKAEVLNNVFLGFSLAIRYKITDKKPSGFDNLYIPGFGTTNDFSEFGAGFNYFVSYNIPLYKKKVKKKNNQ